MQSALRTRGADEATRQVAALMSERPPGPWSYHAFRFGSNNVVSDANGQYLAGNVPSTAGPLMAAGPELLERMARIASLTSSGSPANAIARATLREFGYRRASLRIVGEAR